jgi:hypothetical protein
VRKRPTDQLPLVATFTINEVYDAIKVAFPHRLPSPPVKLTWHFKSDGVVTVREGWVHD